MHCSPGSWERVVLRFNEDLVFSVRGRVALAQAEGRMPRQAVMAVGLTLAATQDMGPEGLFW
jgi:hypothetical protein